MASQYPLRPMDLEIRLLLEPDQPLLDTLHPDTPPDMPVYVEVAIDGVTRGKMALAEIEHEGADRLAILGMTGAPGFVEIALQAPSLWRIAWGSMGPWPRL